MNYRRLAYIVFGMLLAPVCMAQDISWFDESGAFHRGDPLPYINHVIDGTVNAPAVKEIIRSILPDGKAFPRDKLPALSRKSMNSHTPFAVYYPDRKLLSRTRKTIYRYFKHAIKMRKSGSLMVLSYGVRVKGPLEDVGLPTRNDLWLLPADPVFISRLPKPGRENVEVLTDMLSKKMKERAIRRMVRRIPVDIAGKTELKNLPEGPYLLWVNQYNMLTYLYRIYVSYGQLAKVHLNTPFSLQSLAVSAGKK